jgi:hypothetical protein
VLVPLIPVAIVLELLHADAVAVFAASALGVIPTAALMGRATEELAARSGHHLRRAWAHLLLRLRCHVPGTRSSQEVTSYISRSGASKWIRWLLPGTVRNVECGMSACRRSARSIGIHWSCSPHTM